MTTMSRDTVVSIVLLLFCGFMIWAGTLIRDPQFGELPPAAWPKAVTWVLTAFCVVYFLQSIIADRRGTAPERVAGPESGTGLGGWVRYYFNPIVCFAIYFGFLATLPFFGTLIGGTLLVFALLSFLGGIAPRQIVVHAIIAVVSVGAMWALFTYGLRVLLPRGEIFPGI